MLKCVVHKAVEQSMHVDRVQPCAMSILGMDTALGRFHIVGVCQVYLKAQLLNFRQLYETFVARLLGLLHDRYDQRCICANSRLHRSHHF